MRILMLTNTFTPVVGGVARSVEAFTAEYRKMGHDVLVVAPSFAGAPEDEPHVVRVPSIQKFNGTDWSVPVPVPGYLTTLLSRFRPEVVHSHHPFLLGGTALRIAASWDVPAVFTHHTQYDQYTHYVPGDSAALKRFVVDLATGYANMCDAVIAPSRSMADLLSRHGVTSRLAVIPTGVDLERFGTGDGAAFRARVGLPQDAFVVGHVGRLAPEKNLGFLARSVARFLARARNARFLVVGGGSAATELVAQLEDAGVGKQLVMAGTLVEQDLVDAYQAMDAFAFASRTETQGMVVTEAMAAGVPVVALDAPGVTDVVQDGRNGWLLPEEDADAFARALAQLAVVPTERRAELRAQVRRATEPFSMPRTAQRAIDLYTDLIAARRRRGSRITGPLRTLARRINEEWRIATNVMAALVGVRWLGREG